VSDHSDDRPRACVVCQVRQDGYGPDGEHCFGCAPLCSECDRVLEPANTVAGSEACTRCMEPGEPDLSGGGGYNPSWNADCGRWLP